MENIILDAWVECILASADGSVDLPGFPPDHVQQRFVGRSWAAMPIAWSKRSISALDLVRFENNQPGFDQAVIIARKR
jgi:hypothetical protein